MEMPKEMFPVFDFEDGKMVVKPVLQIVLEQL
jgi:UTP-glucose-1-phosphate uridylyltransferase